MKYIIKAILTFTILSISQLAYSASITDTYATGDTLTAATLNNIKTAVNDNDTRITALQTPSGFAAIHAASFQSEGAVGIAPCNWSVDLAAGARGYFLNSSVVGCDAISGIQLPHGVVVNSFSCVFFHRATLTGESVSAQLLKVDHANFTATAVFETPATTNIVRQTVSDTTASSVNDATIDNSANSYLVKLQFSNGNLDADLTFAGCNIGYN